MIISPCNGLAKCFRHPSGCSKIVVSAREEYARRQAYKARRRWLWHLVREQFRLGVKWGLDPIPKRHWLNAVLLMESARNGP